MTQSRILITGGTGFAGSHLVEALLAARQTDVHVTAFGTQSSFVNTVLPADHIHSLDLTDSAAAFKLVKKLQPTQVYHLAAYASVAASFGQGQVVLENNLKLQLNVLEAIRTHAPKARVLAIGSGMEYDVMQAAALNQRIREDHPLGPVSPYAISKVIQDLLSLSYAYSYKLDIVRARPFNHIGERQTIDFAVPSFAKQIVAIERGKQKNIQVGNLDAIRDFTDVKDIAQAYLILLANGTTHDVYNVGSGQGRTMQTVLDLLIKEAKAPIKVVIDPAKVRPLDVPSVVADNQKITLLGWAPHIPIETTLERVLAEWRALP